MKKYTAWSRLLRTDHGNEAIQSTAILAVSATVLLGLLGAGHTVQKRGREAIETLLADSSGNAVGTSASSSRGDIAVPPLRSNMKAFAATSRSGTGLETNGFVAANESPLPVGRVSADTPPADQEPSDEPGTDDPRSAYRVAVPPDKPDIDEEEPNEPVDPEEDPNGEDPCETEPGKEEHGEKEPKEEEPGEEKSSKKDSRVRKSGTAIPLANSANSTDSDASISDGIGDYSGGSGFPTAGNGGPGFQNSGFGNQNGFPPYGQNGGGYPGSGYSNNGFPNNTYGGDDREDPDSGTTGSRRKRSSEGPPDDAAAAGDDTDPDTDTKTENGGKQQTGREMLTRDSNATSPVAYPDDGFATDSGFVHGDDSETSDAGTELDPTGSQSGQQSSSDDDLNARDDENNALESEQRPDVRLAEFDEIAVVGIDHTDPKTPRLIVKINIDFDQIQVRTGTQHLAFRAPPAGMTGTIPLTIKLAQPGNEIEVIGVNAGSQIVAHYKVPASGLPQTEFTLTKDDPVIPGFGEQ